MIIDGDKFTIDTINIFKPKYLKILESGYTSTTPPLL